MGAATLEKLIELADGHQKADEYIAGQYEWSGGSCAIGCTIRDAKQLGIVPKSAKAGDHAVLAKYTNVPELAWRLCDAIFENLPSESQSQWTPRFLRSVRPGADYSAFPARIMVRLARRLGADAIREELKPICLVIATLWERRASGDEPPRSEWGAAHQQADAAFQQADAAYRQADAARQQADAAYWQADAAHRQADAAYQQADAAHRQADAAYRQADAAYRQADAAYQQAGAAYRQARAACWQADAADQQADAAYWQAGAARQQADAAHQQADAAYRQADAARQQADAARQQADAADQQAGAASRQADAAYRQADAARQQAGAARQQFYIWLADQVCECLQG